MTRTFRRLGWGRLAFAVCLTAFAAADLIHTAVAHEVKAGDLTLEHPWTRATPTGAKVAGGFVVIRNTGSAPDRLVGGTADFAGKLEIHEMAMEGDVMKMRPVDGGLEIPAGGEVALKPGSFHIMFMGLKAGLAEGDAVKGTLVFEKAGAVEVEWAVEGMGAPGPSHTGHAE